MGDLLRFPRPLDPVDHRVHAFESHSLVEQRVLRIESQRVVFRRRWRWSYHNHHEYYRRKQRDPPKRDDVSYSTDAQSISFARTPTLGDPSRNRGHPSYDSLTFANRQRDTVDREMNIHSRGEFDHAHLLSSSYSHTDGSSIHHTTCQLSGDLVHTHHSVLIA